MRLLSILLIIIVNYNVENLFHPAHDSLKDDIEWTQEGERRWSYTRYYRKVENIARVLTNIGEWEGVDVVGLQEVENERVPSFIDAPSRLSAGDKSPNSSLAR